MKLFVHNFEICTPPDIETLIMNLLVNIVSLPLFNAFSSEEFRLTENNHDSGCVSLNRILKFSPMISSWGYFRSVTSFTYYSTRIEVVY